MKLTYHFSNGVSQIKTYYYHSFSCVFLSPDQMHFSVFPSPDDGILRLTVDGNSTVSPIWCFQFRKISKNTDWDPFSSSPLSSFSPSPSSEPLVSENTLFDSSKITVEILVCFLNYWFEKSYSGSTSQFGTSFYKNYQLFPCGFWGPRSPRCQLCRSKHTLVRALTRWVNK